MDQRLVIEEVEERADEQQQINPLRLDLFRNSYVTRQTTRQDYRPSRKSHEGRFHRLPNYKLQQIINVRELRSCRYVCSAWNIEIQQFLKKAKSICIVEENFDQVEQLLQESFNGKDVYLSRVECKYSNCSNQLFDKLILRLGNNIHKLILNGCEVNVNSFQCLLLSDPFPHLSTLVLSHLSYRDPLQGRHTIFILDEENPSVLKSLSRLEINERGPNSQTTLKNITRMCPNLKWFAYGNCPCPDVNDFRRTDLVLCSLEYLQLAPMDGRRMTYEYFEALTHLKLQSLKTIFLYGMDPGGVKRMRCLKNFLKSVSNTLDSLHLGQRIMYDPEYKKGTASPFPVSLPNIKKMSIGPGFVNSMKFLNKLPNLMSFTCVRTKSGDWTRLVKQGAPNRHEMIKILDLGDVSHNPLEKLGPCFPNLVKLELNLSRVENHDDLVRAIFGNFLKLQTFSFYDLSNQNRLTDSGITGIPAPIGESDPTSCRTFPYIGNLKCLIDLRLQYLSRQLTDASVALGIKDVPSLFALDLSNSQITNESLEVIAKCLPNLSMLYIRNCSKLTSEGITRFKDTRKQVQLRYQTG